MELLNLNPFIFVPFKKKKLDCDNNHCLVLIPSFCCEKIEIHGVVFNAGKFRKNVFVLDCC
jgi:hypothetical protein